MPNDRDEEFLCTKLTDGLDYSVKQEDIWAELKVVLDEFDG